MTNGEPLPQPDRRALQTGRVEALSDGVFAIAITLLVLDIAVPAHAERDLLRAVGDQWPSYLAYAVSFSTIGALWLGHNAISEYLDRSDAVFIRLNLLLLLLVAFLPFPTRLFADYISEDRPERVAATIYGVSLLVASTLLWVLWRYAVHAHPAAANRTLKRYARFLADIPLGNGPGKVLGLPRRASENESDSLSLSRPGGLSWGGGEASECGCRAVR
jgi:uncharacterized membrane protein